LVVAIHSKRKSTFEQVVAIRETTKSNLSKPLQIIQKPMKFVFLRCNSFKAEKHK
jgi:hypothetical protein